MGETQKMMLYAAKEKTAKRPTDMIRNRLHCVCLHLPKECTCQKKKRVRGYKTLQPYSLKKRSIESS
jgi:hypothetical protein